LSWNTDHHIFVCCWDIWHIPHTSWYSVLLSQNTQWTITSHHFSKLTIFISVFRIFRQPDFSFLVCQFLNDQYQQPCTNNFLVIFLTDKWTERQTNIQTNERTNKQTNSYFNYKTNWIPELTKKNCWIMLSCNQICTKLLYCQFLQKPQSEFCSCHVYYLLENPIRTPYQEDAMWYAEIITLLYIWRKGILLPFSFNSEYFFFRDAEIHLAVFAAALVA
jgi:hypothetical protein